MYDLADGPNNTVYNYSVHVKGLPSIESALAEIEETEIFDASFLYDGDDQSINFSRMAEMYTDEEDAISKTCEEIEQVFPDIEIVMVKPSAWATVEEGING